MKNKSLFDEIGVKPYRENGDMKPLTEVLRELQEEIKKMEKVENEVKNRHPAFKTHRNRGG